jgi:WD40 repeat protein
MKRDLIKLIVKNHPNFQLHNYLEKNLNKSFLELFLDLIKNNEQTFRNLTNVLKGHSAQINCIIQLCNKKLVSGSSDKTIIIWDSKNNFNIEYTLKGHSDTICQLTQIDNILISASGDGLLIFWNIAEGFTLIKSLQAHKKPIYCLCKINQNLFASGSEDRQIKFWNINMNSNQPIYTLTSHTNIINELLMVDDNTMASASGDCSIIIWSIENPEPKQLYILKDHEGSVYTLYLNLKRTRLLSGSADRTIKEWDLSSYSCVNTVALNYTIYKIIYLKYGKLAVCTMDGVIRIRRECDLEYLNLLINRQYSVFTLRQLKDQRIVYGALDHTIKIWE